MSNLSDPPRPAGYIPSGEAAVPCEAEICIIGDISHLLAPDTHDEWRRLNDGDPAGDR